MNDLLKNHGGTEFPYEDILHLPHPVSKRHPQMSMYQRAAQFAPFAALTGRQDPEDSDSDESR